MSLDLDRDFIGYGPTPPNPQWPGGARLALNFVLNYEEGSEPSHADGDGVSETGLTELGTAASGVPGRDLAAESMFEYGARVGVWRLLRLFSDRDLPLTVFACAQALERNPAVAHAIAAADHDICAHGLRWVRHTDLDEASERAQIAAAYAAIERATGRRPDGWYCRYAPGLNTRRLVVEHGGFLYDSDSYADELPYWTMVTGQPHLIVPYSLTTNDTKFVRGGMSMGDQFTAFLRDSVEMLVEEGRDHPKMMSVGLHARVIGHPARARALGGFLDEMAARNDVWVTRRVDIAHHWLARHPPPFMSGGRACDL
ncbi:MAG: polysaccharide deacetylase family protein [Minwuia sp.]|nr:polysaccharide deacetylase family protein [Minwuia sp.]